MKPLTMTEDLLDAAHSTQVGRSIEVRPGEPAETVIRMAGRDQRSQMLTATIALEPATLPGTGKREVAGILRWGAGGAQLQAEFDLLLGVMVSVPASYLEVLARNEGKLPARVSATMGYGARPGGRPLARTVSYGPLSTGVTVERAIPSWATSAVVLFESTITQLEATVQDFEGDEMFGGSDVPMGLEMPLPNGAAQVAVNAVAGSGTAYLRYTLAL